MATKKKATKAVEAPKKDDKPQKKKNGKKSSQTRSPWALAFFAVLGMYLLTIVWPTPFEKITTLPVVEDILPAPTLAETKPAPVKEVVIEDAGVNMNVTTQEAVETEITFIEEEPIIDEHIEVINQLNQKINALTEITETQSQEIESLNIQTEEQRLALMALSNPASVVDVLKTEPAFVGTDLSLLAGKRLSANKTVVKLLDAIHKGPLSREERAQEASGNILAESDSAWKKSLSKWVTVKKQTVEDYAMSYDEQWEAHSDKLKAHLMDGNYEATVAWIRESPILSVDRRFTEGGKELLTYMNQQKLLERVRAFYAR